MLDTDDVIAFMATHARLLDRQRAQLALGTGSADAVLAALAGYRNPDGGYGWGLEPDLRAPSSQPAGALHAFEVFEEVAPATTPNAAALCDWLGERSLDGGALPFSLAGADQPGSAPWWAKADPSVPSLHITAAVVGSAHRVARHDRAVADHPWLPRATAWCMDGIARIEGADRAYELLYVLLMLDAVHDVVPKAPAELSRVAAFLPPSGALPVGVGDELLRPLAFSPWPDRPLRAAINSQAIADDLARLRDEQLPDGGWDVDFTPGSPMAALEWRGYATVSAVRILTANG